MKRTSAASATRFLSSLRPARRQGLFPANSLALSPGARPTSGSGSKANSAVRFLLLHGCLVEHEVPLRAPRESLDASRDEVDQVRVEHRDPGCLIGHSLVDLRPDVIRLRDVLRSNRCRIVHMVLNPLVA